jgi:multiple sugar transport system permease protein
VSATRRKRNIHHGYLVLTCPLGFDLTSSVFTLPRGLKEILDQFGQGGEGQWEVVLAASVIATLPMLVSFLGQRSFVEGIATTGRKG